jgi:hypothetical protein
MRSSDLRARIAAIATAAVAASACSFPIGPDRSIQDASPPSPSLPVARGCLVFGGPSPAAPSLGSPISLATATGARWIVPTSLGAKMRPFTSAEIDPCAVVSWDDGDVHDALDASPFGANDTRTIDSATSTSSTTLVYYEELAPDADAAFGVRSLGHGVALFDVARDRFVPTDALLWTADRPSFGVASVAVGDVVFAIGCRGSGFLSADCYASHVDAGHAGDPASYAYATGDGHDSSNVDDAWPIVRSAGTQVDVAWLPSLGRFVMAYATPLGRTLHLRSGLAPDGPWSGDLEVAACDLADPDFFCTDVHLHAELATDGATIPLTYGVASLASDAGARAAAHPERFWPRFVRLDVPGSLP